MLSTLWEGQQLRWLLLWVRWKLLSFPKLLKKQSFRFWCFLLEKHYLMTCSELTRCWALFSTSPHVRVNLCSIPMFDFLKTQMILPVRTGATVEVCKFLQCHHFGNSKRKLVTLELSELQHQVLIGSSLVGKNDCSARRQELSWALQLCTGSEPPPTLTLFLGEGEVLQPVPS